MVSTILAQFSRLKYCASPRLEFHDQVKELDLILAQIDEITVFWDTGTFVNDAEISENA